MNKSKLNRYLRTYSNDYSFNLFVSIMLYVLVMMSLFILLFTRYAPEKANSETTTTFTVELNNTTSTQEKEVLINQIRDYAEVLNSSVSKGKLTFKTSTENKDKLQAITDKLKNRGQITYVEVMTTPLSSNSLTNCLLLMLGSALLIGLMFSLYFNIKYVITSQKENLKSMKLVGASSWSIKKHFLTKYTWYTLFYGLVTVIFYSLMYCLVLYINNTTIGIQEIENIYLSAILTIPLSIIVVMLFINLLLNKYLNR